MSQTLVRTPESPRSGGTGKNVLSARAGFLPVPLDHAPVDAFDGIAIYLKIVSPKGDGSERFTLFSSAQVRFTDAHRARLQSQGLRFVYVPIADHVRLRRQTEACLEKIASDPKMSLAGRCEIIYETSVELVNELLDEPDLAAHSPRLVAMSRAVTTLVLCDPSAFTQLFAASHHDFYTATHMVNVGTWMVPLAYACGIQDINQLGIICQAGLLHDIGKIYVSEEILNKMGPLSDADWVAIKRHPELGVQHLAKMAGIEELVMTVASQHHERLDGSGYPAGLKGDQLHLVSRICAVIDSFDAMTAFRPFKQRTTSVHDALAILTREAPRKYDADIVGAWVKLMESAAEGRPPLEGAPPPAPADSDRTIERTDAGEIRVRLGRRRFPRYPINCEARVYLTADPTHAPIKGIAHNISSNGLGLLLPTQIATGEHLRIELRGGGTLNRDVETLSIRCRAYRDGFYEVGAKLLTPETAADSLSEQAALKARDS